MRFSRSSFVAPALTLLSQRTLADLNVTSWSSPASGDAYESSQVLNCIFQSDSLLNSPGFRLCIVSQDADYDNEDEDKDGEQCGSLMFPDVEQNGNTYTTALTMPDVDLDLQCYLQMEDGAGDATTSPVFLITPTKPQQPIRGQSFAALSVSSQPTSPLTDESSSLPSRAIIYAIPLVLLSVIILIGITVYVYRRRKANNPLTVCPHGKDRDACMEDKCGDPITCAHSLPPRVSRQNSSSSEKAGTDDIYTAVYHRTSPLNRNQPRQSTKEPFRPRGRRSTVPARLFKDIMSDTSSTEGQMPVSEESSRPLPSTVTYDKIASQYLQPSSTSYAIAAEAITPPKRLHTRRGTNAGSGIARRVTHGYSGSL